MKKINQDIKDKSFENYYLLFGEENYLVKQYKNRLKDALVLPDDTMNYSFFEGAGLDKAAIEDIAMTMPFFAEKRLVLIQNSGLFKAKKKDEEEEPSKTKTKDSEPFSFVANKAEDTIVVFVEEEVDKRGKFYKFINSNGYVCELKKQDANTLARWVLGILKKEGYSITDSSLKKFLETVGDDMGNIYSELDKLMSYTLETKEITAQDISTVCIKDVSLVIFDITNAIMEKNSDKVIRLYHELLANKEAPMHILYLLVRQFNIIYQIKCLGDMSLRQMAQKTSINEYALKMSIPFAKNFEKTTLESALKDCAEFEERFKTGMIDDVTGLEMLLVKYSTK